MADLECPYCNEEVEVCHDDGFGYEENVKHQIECDNCGKYFVFETYISFSYSPTKADCLNDSTHDFKPSQTFPREFSRMVCAMCGEEREPTKDEWQEILK